MDPTESLRGYAGGTNQNLQTHDHHFSNTMISSDSYNFMTGGGVLEVPLKDQASQLQGPPISEEGGAGQDPTGPLIGTLYTNQHPSSSGDYPSRSPTVPKPNWENLSGGGLYSNSSMQNILIGGTGMMTAPAGAATAQLLIGGLQGGSFTDGGHSDHGNVYYTSAANNQQEPMEQLYYVNTAGYNSNAGFRSDGRDPASATTILYPTHDEGTATPQSSCDQGQQQFRVDPFLAAAAGGIPLSLHEHSASRSANQNSYNWRNGGNEHSFLPMNEDSQNHQSQFDTDQHVPQFNVPRACHDLSHMQQTDHMSNGTVGLHVERLKGISVNGQGLSLSLSSHQSQFHSTGGGQLPDQADHMAAIGQAAALAKTKELASRYITGNSADLSRFRTQSRDDALMGTRFLQEHMDSAGRKYHASNTHSGASGAGSSNHVSVSRFLGSAQAILNEVCRVTILKRHPKPARSSDHQQHNWNNMAGGSSASVDGNYTYNGKQDSARSSILTEIDSGRDPAPAFNIHTTPLITVSHIPLESEMIQGLADAARSQNRDDLESKKQKLSLMLDEVEARYRRYCDQLQLVVTRFNSLAGPNTANPYTILALQAMSRHFRCLRDAIGNQLKIVKRALGEDVDRNAGLGETSRLRYVDQQIRQQRALQQLGMLQQHAWRPQRGLPERAVSVLRAWLFEHFLHPYPKDVDKLALAKQTGLTRSQVSNWFINARVRLWKPMVEEMYVEEQKENEERLAAEKLARDQAEIENGTYDQYEGDRGNSGLLHEVSANAQPSRNPNGMKRNEDREHIDSGPGVVTEVAGTTAEVNLHPVMPIGQLLDADVAGNYNQDSREAKKARSSSASDVFKPNSSNLLHPGMNIEGGKLGQEAVIFQGEDVRGKDDANFGIQSQALNQNNQDQKSYPQLSQQGTATADHVQPNAGAGAFGAFDGRNIGLRSYGNHEPELRGYATRAASATTSTGAVSLTLGLRHCDSVNQHRSSMVSSTGNLSKPYDMDADDHMNQLTRVDLYEGRIGEVSHNGQSTSTAMTNVHYLQQAQDNPNNSNNSNNSNSQQRSPPHREFNAAT